MARKKGGLPVGPPPVAGWLATYSEMVTIMLCFLVLMLSTSSIDAAQFQKVATALRGTFYRSGITSQPSDTLPREEEQHGGLPGAVTVPQMHDSVSPSTSAVVFEEVLEVLSEEAETRAQQMITILSEVLEEQGVYQGVELKASLRGVIVRFTDTVLFDLASAALRPEALEMLDALLGPLRALDNILIIEGHTSDLPLPAGEYEDNRALSSSRALAVLRFFQQRGIDPQRLRSIGYGEYQNIVPNTSEENRQRNRRVDIIIMNRQSD